MTTTSAQDADLIIRRAHEAYCATRHIAPQVRASWLEAIASALQEEADDLVRLAAKETHLAEGRLYGELRRTAFQLQLFADEVRIGEPYDATIDHEDDSWGMGPRPDIRRVNVPLGVVGVFGASNFPFAFSVAGGDTASALAAGCAVVHKIHSAHLELGIRTTEVVNAALRAADAPAALFAAVSGREAANTLVDHPLVKAIGFTGSTVGGRSLFDRASRRPEPIPFYGELGSINPVFVTEAAWHSRRERILKEYAQSFTLGMGQFCTKPGLFFAPIADSGPDGVVSDLVDALGNSPVAPMLSPHLNGEFAAAVAEICSDGDVSVLVEGSFGEVPQPTVLFTTAETVQRKPALLAQEMFGPATLVIGNREGADLVPLARLLEGQLTATVHAGDGEDLSELVTTLEERSGRVIWNGWPTGVTVSYAQQHGGPYPATTASGTTSVGTDAVRRFMRPVAFQSFPDAQLPESLHNDNPWLIRRRVDGRWEPSPNP